MDTQFIEDEEGNSLTFSELPENVKEAVTKKIDEESIEHMIEIFEKNEEILEIVAIQNLAFEETINTASRNTIINDSREEFTQVYIQNMERLLSQFNKNNNSRNSLGVSKKINMLIKVILFPVH